MDEKEASDASAAERNPAKGTIAEIAAFRALKARRVELGLDASVALRIFRALRDNARALFSPIEEALSSAAPLYRQPT